jgi:hypothetical protein
MDGDPLRLSRIHVPFMEPRTPPDDEMGSVMDGVGISSVAPTVLYLPLACPLTQPKAIYLIT